MSYIYINAPTSSRTMLEKSAEVLNLRSDESTKNCSSSSRRYIYGCKRRESWLEYAFLLLLMNRRSWRNFFLSISLTLFSLLHFVKIWWNVASERKLRIPSWSFLLLLLLFQVFRVEDCGDSKKQKECERERKEH